MASVAAGFDQSNCRVRWHLRTSAPATKVLPDKYTIG